jgi:hypothetical protein
VFWGSSVFGGEHFLHPPYTNFSVAKFSDDGGAGFPPPVVAHTLLVVMW